MQLKEMNIFPPEICFKNASNTLRVKWFIIKEKYVFCSVDVTIDFLQMPFSFMILIILL